VSNDSAGPEIMEREGVIFLMAASGICHLKNPEWIIRCVSPRSYQVAIRMEMGKPAPIANIARLVSRFVISPVISNGKATATHIVMVAIKTIKSETSTLDL
jgi:hypothetical protein